jgi:hypothetical protein
MQTRKYELVSWKDFLCDSPFGTPETTVIETNNLPPNLVFEEGSDRMDAVYFIPPDPKTVLDFNGSLATNRAGYIYLGTADGSLRKPMSVNAGGQINF